MAEKYGEIWQSADMVQGYLQGTRGAIPCAREQIGIMLRLLDTVPGGVSRFIDLGCGDGVLGAAVLGRWSKAQGIFVDFSSAMIQAACARFGDNPNVAFLEVDYGDKAWTDQVAGDAPFNAVVSGFSIHHQPDDRKMELYAEIFDLLSPGGVFVNVEHVTPGSALAEELFEEHFVDSLYALSRGEGGGKTRDEIATEFRNREDKDANILAPVEVQLDWLRQIGYGDVDCFLRVFELAVFAGRKPA